MLLTQDTNDAMFQIRAYQPGKITVNNQVYSRSLIVMPQQLIEDWVPQSFMELTPEHWEPLFGLNLEVILLGTGRHFKMPHPRLLAPIYAHRIGVESMDTRAACRTYMALAAEGRRVAAALLID